MEISMCMDWLSITIPDNAIDPNRAIPGRWRYLGQGMHGYREKWQDSDTNALFQTQGPEAMGSHYTLSGDVLRTIRQNGVSDQELAGNFIALGGRASRVDLAIDVFDSAISVPVVQEAFMAKQVRFKAKKVHRVEERDEHGNLTGDGFNVGSRGSARYLRVYNKGLEQKIKSPKDWLRFEAELADVIARGSVGSVAMNGIESTARGTIGDMMEWPTNEVFRAIMTGPTVPAAKAGRRDTNTEQWLLGPVLDTLANVINRKPEFLETFLTRLSEKTNINSLEG